MDQYNYTIYKTTRDVTLTLINGIKYVSRVGQDINNVNVRQGFAYGTRFGVLNKLRQTAFGQLQIHDKVVV